MRTEDQIKSKLHELQQLLENSQEHMRASTVHSQIDMLQWVLHNPTGPYHFEDEQTTPH